MYLYDTYLFILLQMAMKYFNYYTIYYNKNLLK